jgi:hypothetical protein
MYSHPCMSLYDSRADYAITCILDHEVRSHADGSVIRGRRVHSPLKSQLTENSAGSPTSLTFTTLRLFCAMFVEVKRILSPAGCGHSFGNIAHGKLRYIVRSIHRRGLDCLKDAQRIRDFVPLKATLFEGFLTEITLHFASDMEPLPEYAGMWIYFDSGKAKYRPFTQRCFRSSTRSPSFYLSNSDSIVSLQSS